jgi:hypothetical protein
LREGFLFFLLPQRHKDAKNHFFFNALRPARSGGEGLVWKKLLTAKAKAPIFHEATNFTQSRGGAKEMDCEKLFSR